MYIKNGCAGVGKVSLAVARDALVLIPLFGLGC